MRTYSKDGVLHVERSNISKAMVCPYLGAEIPKFAELGLDPARIYYLYRDPDELARAVSTFNNLPILSRHVPVTAESFPDELLVGTTGTDSAFNFPYLTNSTSFWKQAAITKIEQEEEKELSAAYHYDADMTPGAINGLRFDGIMRNIIGNHVAQVKEGRAGPDVVVGDSKLEVSGMATSKYASMITGALMVALSPMLAQDAKLDVTKLTDGVKSKADKTKFLDRLKAQTAGKLAQDADLDALVTLLDKLDDVVTEEEEAPAAADAEGDPASKMLAYCKDKMSDDDYGGLAALMGEGMGADEEPDPDDKKKDDNVKFDKGAMDAAIKAASDKATADAVARINNLHAAREEVKPLVGNITVAMDSASEVYKFALEKSGVTLAMDHSEAALRQMVALKLEATKTPAPKPVIAQDAAAVEDFNKRFPNANRLMAS